MVDQFKRTIYDFLKELPRDKEIPEGCANEVFVELFHGKNKDNT